MKPAELAAIRERHAATAAERDTGECARCDLPIDEDPVRCEETEGWSACVLPIDDEAHADRAALLREVERLTDRAAGLESDTATLNAEVLRLAAERDAARLSGDGEHARADQLWRDGNAAREEVERLRAELGTARARSEEQRRSILDLQEALRARNP